MRAVGGAARWLPSGGSPRAWLVAVGIGYGVAQLLLVGHMRLGWDETVYVSQVSPHVPTAYFSAPRARGVTWLVAPVAVLTTSVTALRVYLAVASSVALVVSFGLWLRLWRGPAVPLAAGLFAALWTALFYGPAVMPNLWIAFAAVAATALVLRMAGVGGWRGGRGTLLALAVVVAAAAWFRPTDSLTLAGPLGLAVLVVPVWRRRRVVLAVLGALIAGLVVGWVPWVVESVVSYGGVGQRWERASAVQGGTGLQFSLDLQLRSVNGPGLCRPCVREEHPIPVTASLWWATGVAAVGIAVLQARRDRARTLVTLLPLGVATVLALPYVFLLGYAAPRFLLPTYALAVLPLAQGLIGAPRLWRSPGLRSLTRLAVVGIVVVHLAYQLVVLYVVVRANDRGREMWTQVVAGLRAEGVRPPCVLAGRQAAPIAFYAGCDSRQVSGNDASATPADLERLAEEQPVALIFHASHPVPRLARDWRVAPLEQVTIGPDWVAYLPPRG